jgi:PiT family inorganic phosphate transporter
MLILIGIVPAHFALNTSLSPAKLQESIVNTRSVLVDIPSSNLGSAEKASTTKIFTLLADLDAVIGTAKVVPKLPEKQNFHVRKDILLVSKEIDKILASESVALTNLGRKQLEASKKDLREYTDYAPRWVIYLISISLGLGTMVGWKRIVLTIGEKIGKQHLTYAQGASAEVVASLTIGLANVFTLPVSTTHVLSSGIAGSMVANKGLKNLQPATIRSILLAWVLTLPVTVVTSGVLYVLLRKVM